MRRFLALTCILIPLAHASSARSASGGHVPAKAPASFGDEAEWGALMILNGSNGLSAEVGADLREAYESAHVESRAHALAVMDVNGDGTNPNTTSWYFVSAHETLNQEDLDAPNPNAEFDDGGFASSAALEGTAKWFMTSVAARKRAVVISGHGFGPRGPSDEEESPTDMQNVVLTSKEVLTTSLPVEVVVDALATGLGNRIQVLGLDSCLMASLEVAYAFRNVTSLLVASEEEEPSTGWNHKRWLDHLAKDEKVPDGLGVALLMANSYVSYASAFVDHRSTISVVRTDDMDGAAKKLDSIASRLLKGWSSAGFRDVVSKSRSKCATIHAGVRPKPVTGMVDLRCLLDALRTEIPPNNDLLIDDVRALRESLFGTANGAAKKCVADGDATVVCNVRFGKVLKVLQQSSETGGLSIFFPQKSDRKPTWTKEYVCGTAKPQIAFTKAAPQWGKLVNAYLDDAYSCPSP